jgi:hypothetical protein
LGFCAVADWILEMSNSRKLSLLDEAIADCKRNNASAESAGERRLWRLLGEKLEAALAQQEQPYTCGDVVCERKGCPYKNNPCVSAQQAQCANCESEQCCKLHGTGCKEMGCENCSQQALMNDTEPSWKPELDAYRAGRRDGVKQERGRMAQKSYKTEQLNSIKRGEMINPCNEYGVSDALLEAIEAALERGGIKGNSDFFCNIIGELKPLFGIALTEPEFMCDRDEGGECAGYTCRGDQPCAMKAGLEDECDHEGETGPHETIVDDLPYPIGTITGHCPGPKKKPSD